MEISAKELAQLINVSPATVSMVFNNKPGISEATRDLVLTTAAKYGYTPKSAPPASASSRVIQLINYKKHGKIAADTPFFSQLTEGITQEFRPAHITEGGGLHRHSASGYGNAKGGFQKIQGFSRTDCGT